MIKTIRAADKKSRYFCLLRLLFFLIFANRTGSGGFLRGAGFANRSSRVFCSLLLLSIFTLRNRIFTLPKSGDARIFCDHRLSERGFYKPVSKSKVRRRILSPPHLPNASFSIQRMCLFCVHFSFFAEKGYTCCRTACNQQNDPQCKIAVVAGLWIVFVRSGRLRRFGGL